MPRRDVDVTALLAGMVFLAAGAAASVATATGTVLDARWTVPLLLIGLGVAGIASFVRGGRRSRGDGRRGRDAGAGTTPG